LVFNLPLSCTLLFLDVVFQRNVSCENDKYTMVDDDDNNNNNNNKGSRSMGEVAPLYGVDSALVRTNPGVQ
jgi:hypothetical protein